MEKRLTPFQNATGFGPEICLSALVLTPIENVYKFPRVLLVFHCQFLGLFIDNELASRKKYASALSLLIAKIELEGR